jgi:hypothetical protein
MLAGKLSGDRPMSSINPDGSTQSNPGEERLDGSRKKPDSAAELELELARMHRELLSEPDKYRASLLRAHKFRLEARLEALRLGTA